MLDFRTETFLCVCRHMNFTRAAGELGITQAGCIPAHPFSGRILSRPAVCHEREKAFSDRAGRAPAPGSHYHPDDEALLQKELQESPAAPNLWPSARTMTVGEYLLPRPLSRFIKAHRRNP